MRWTNVGAMMQLEEKDLLGTSIRSCDQIDQKSICLNGLSQFRYWAPCIYIFFCCADVVCDGLNHHSLRVRCRPAGSFG